VPCRKTQANVLCAVNSSTRRRRNTDPAHAGAMPTCAALRIAVLNSRRTAQTLYAGTKCAYFAFRDCKMSTAIGVQLVAVCTAQTGKNGSGKRRPAQRRPVPKRSSSASNNHHSQCQVLLQGPRKPLHFRKKPNRTQEAPCCQQRFSPRPQINQGPRAYNPRMSMSVTGLRSLMSRQRVPALLESLPEFQKHHRWPVTAAIPTQA
jgi:hypothetical protein